MSIQKKSLKNKQFRYFFILEIIIALGLISIIFSAIFSFWVQFSKIEVKLAEARREFIPLHQARIRLNLLFSSLVLPQSNSLFPETFYMDHALKEKELWIVFDNGIDIEPCYSGVVEGRIYLDSSNRLLVQVYSSKTKDSFRREVLCSDVQRFTFEFFHVKPLYMGLQSIWEVRWEKEWKELPVMIRLSIWKKGAETPERMAFSVPAADGVITYR